MTPGGHQTKVPRRHLAPPQTGRTDFPYPAFRVASWRGIRFAFMDASTRLVPATTKAIAHNHASQNAFGPSGCECGPLRLRVPSYGDFPQNGNAVSYVCVDCEMAGVVYGLFLFPDPPDLNNQAQSRKVPLFFPPSFLCYFVVQNPCLVSCPSVFLCLRGEFRLRSEIYPPEKPKADYSCNLDIKKL